MQERTNIYPSDATEKWLSQEHESITRSAATVVAAEQIPLHEAYLSGRRDSYNGLREQFVVSHPALEKELPPALEINEIRVRQEVVEQERTVDRSLSVAR